MHPIPTHWCSSAPPAIWPTRRSSRRCRRCSSAATSTCRSSAWPRPAGTSTSSRRGRATASRSTAAASMPAAFDEAVGPAALRRRRLQRCGDLPGHPQGARRGAAAGALPRHSAGAVRHGGGAARQGGLRQGRARHRREAVRPRPGLGAGAQPRSCSPRSTRRTSSASTTTSASGRCTTWSSSASPTRSSSRSGTATHRERADHHGGELRRPGPRRVLRPDRHHPRRGPESPVPGAGQPGDGAARRAPTASRSATRRSRC